MKNYSAKKYAVTVRNHKFLHSNHTNSPAKLAVVCGVGSVSDFAAGHAMISLFNIDY